MKSLTKAGMGFKYHAKDSCHMTSLAVQISRKNSFGAYYLYMFETSGDVNVY
jgi:hypothetical protein